MLRTVVAGPTIDVSSFKRGEKLFILTADEYEREYDPFYAESNQAYLRKAIKELDEGKGVYADFDETGTLVRVDPPMKRAGQ